MVSSSEDNVLAKNENANTAGRKAARRSGCDSGFPLDETPVHSDYGIRLK
jgi:hypothetical protein